MGARGKDACVRYEANPRRAAARRFLISAVGFSALGYAAAAVAYGVLKLDPAYAVVGGCSYVGLVGIVVIAVFLFAAPAPAENDDERPSARHGAQGEPAAEAAVPAPAAAVATTTAATTAAPAAVATPAATSAAAAAAATAAARRAEARMVVRQFNQLIDGELSRFDFTEQEFAVARHILHGNTYKAIGQQLFLSESTVKFHARNICAKAGVETRRDLEKLVRHRIERRIEMPDVERR